MVRCGSAQQRCGKSVDAVAALVMLASAPLNCQDGNPLWRGGHREAASCGYGLNDPEDSVHIALVLGSAISAAIISVRVDYLYSL